MNDTEPIAVEQDERDYDIERVWCRLSTNSGVKRLNTADDEHHSPEVRVSGDHTENAGPKLYIRSHDGAHDEVKVHAEMTAEQAHDLAARLKKAAHAYKRGEPYNE